MIIRKETVADIDAITQVTRAAFKTLEINDNTEQFIIKALRQSGALAISLVAEIDQQIVGHIAFSPVKISDGASGWYGLGPVSILPKLHRQEIGKALIKKGLSLLQDANAQGCALVGYPDYYKRFGFKNYEKLIYEGIPPEVFLILPFTENIPQGIVKFDEGFAAKE